jgi:uncharacterized membrane protein
MIKTYILVASTLVILVSLTSISADIGNEEFSGCGMNYAMNGNYGIFPMLFGWVFGILVLVALVLFIVWLIKQIQRR